jgi:DNA repair protein RadC
VAAHAWELAPSYRPGRSDVIGPEVSESLTNARAAWLATVDIHEAYQEHVIVFDLSVRYRILARRVVGIGTLSSVEVHPREIYRQAIANGAAAVLMVHNHPSGDHAPSRVDLELTERLVIVGEICGIRMIDHVVVSGSGFTSIIDRLAISRLTTSP